MPPKNLGGASKFPGGHKVFHRTAQTAFVRVVTPRFICSKFVVNKMIRHLFGRKLLCVTKQP